MTERRNELHSAIKSIRDRLDQVEALFDDLERAYGVERAASERKPDKRGVYESFEVWREERTKKFGKRPSSVRCDRSAASSEG